VPTQDLQELKLLEEVLDTPTLVLDLLFMEDTQALIHLG
jgi:hypothetical protein